MQKNKPTLLLGTAQFGWTNERKTAFQLLDAFYSNGFRQVDCATNYPINQNPKDFRAAELILKEWIYANGINDLEIMMKVGSVNNLRTPECNLSPSFLLMSLEHYRNFFRENLHTLMIHWDNEDNIKQISATIGALLQIKKEGFDIGLSGIKHPEKYAEAVQNLETSFFIQIKHNILYSDYKRYADFFPDEKYIAYGINAGGIKLNTTEYSEKSTLAVRGGDILNQNEIFSSLEKIILNANQNTSRPPINSFFQLGMINAFYQPYIYGILIGNSSAEQWAETLHFYQNLQMFDYQDVLKNN